MAEIRGDIIIDRPPEAVFDFVADEENEPLYNPEMRVAKKVTEGPIGVGTMFEVEMEGQDAKAMTIKVTEYVRPRVLGVETHMESTMDLGGGITFEPVDGTGTLMRWAWNIQPHGALKLMGPLLTVMGRRRERRIWASLKRLLEARPIQE